MADNCLLGNRGYEFSVLCNFILWHHWGRQRLKAPCGITMQINAFFFCQNSAFFSVRNVRNPETWPEKFRLFTSWIFFKWQCSRVLWFKKYNCICHSCFEINFIIMTFYNEILQANGKHFFLIQKTYLYSLVEMKQQWLYGFKSNKTGNIQF